MGIRGQIGNAISGVRTAWSNTAQEIGAKVSQIFNTASVAIGSIYSGGFIGVNGNNWGEIRNSIEALIEAASNEIAKFDDLANRDDAMKGQAAAALGEYLKACKDLLNAYVSTYRNFITDAETALQAMNTGDTENAQAIQAATQEVEQQARQIQVG